MGRDHAHLGLVSQLSAMHLSCCLSSGTGQRVKNNRSVLQVLLEWVGTSGERSSAYASEVMALTESLRQLHPCCVSMSIQNFESANRGTSWFASFVHKLDNVHLWLLISSANANSVQKLWKDIVP